MFKRVIILLVLSSILLALVLVRNHTSAPVNDSISNNQVSSKYTTVEYKITKIKGNQYYGKSEDGTDIIFSSKNILSGEKIKIHEVVICYFDKNNLGNGLVKVEKK